MKSIYTSMVFVFLSAISYAQENWQGVFLTVAGHHEKNGVEAYFALTECNEEPCVAIKLINKNSNSVTVSWMPAIFTVEKSWINTDRTVTINLPPQSEQVGNCDNDTPLLFRLSLVGLTGEKFRRYAMNYFEVQ